MAIQKITYTNKVAINTDTSVPDINKCKADDLNEIKSVVNNNADEIPSIDNLVNVGTSVDTTYRTNILYSHNLCNGINQNYFINTATTTCGYSAGNIGLAIQVSGGNYTISTTSTQTRYRVGCLNELPTTSAGITLYNGVNKDNSNDAITIDTTGYTYLVINCTDLSKISIVKGSTALPYEPYIIPSIWVDGVKIYEMPTT